MKTSILLLIMSGLVVSCTSSQHRKEFEKIEYVAKASFEADRDAGMVKIYYAAYSPLNIRAANSNLVGNWIFVVGYGDVIQSQLLYQYQQAYNQNVESWLRSSRQTDIDTLLKDFKTQ